MLCRGLSNRKVLQIEDSASRILASSRFRGDADEVARLEKCGLASPFLPFGPFHEACAGIDAVVYWASMRERSAYLSQTRDQFLQNRGEASLKALEGSYKPVEESDPLALMFG